MEVAIVGVLLALGAGLMVYSFRAGSSQGRDAVKRRLVGGRSVDEVADLREQARTSARDNIVKKAAPMLSRLVMPTSDEEQTQLRMKLASAGFRHRQAQTLLLGSKTVLALVGLVAGGVTATSMGCEPLSIAGIATFAGGIGFLAPNLWLGLATKSRKERVRHGLPDILDLLVVSVEAGLALDAAIKRVGEEMALVHSDLSEEFQIATMESSMGIPRVEAMDNMARRADVDELRNLVSVIAQAERFGTSISKALRNQSESLRTKRRQQAEERAQKTAVKLMIPLVLFIFPAMGVVLAGPAAINLSEAFKN